MIKLAWTCVLRVPNSIVTKVGLSVMSRAKNEPGRLRNIYMQTLRMTALVNSPLYVLIGLFASEIVALLYGQQWHDAALYLRVLAAWGLIRSTGNPSGNLIYATGHVKRAFWRNIASLLILPPLYWLAIWVHGLVGLAGGMLVLQLLIVMPPRRFLVKPCCEATLPEFLSPFGAPLPYAMTAGCAAWAATHGVPHGTLRMFVGIIAGGAAYVGLSWWFNHRWVGVIRELLWPQKHDA